MCIYVHMFISAYLSTSVFLLVLSPILGNTWAGSHTVITARPCHTNDAGGLEQRYRQIAVVLSLPAHTVRLPVSHRWVMWTRTALQMNRSGV